MNLESENTFTSGQLVVISSEESFKKSFLETAEDDEKGACYSRRRSVHFVSDPTTVLVPGSEEKEHRGRGEGPTVRVKEIHPGGISEDVSEESDGGEADEEEKLRLRQARETARRQSEPVFMSNMQRKTSSRMRSPPPERTMSMNQDDDDEEDPVDNEKSKMTEDPMIHSEKNYI